jgi:hypothetical protein
MAKKLISQVRVFRKGQRLLNLMNFKMSAEKYGEKVQTMDGIMVVELPRDVDFTLDYAIPKENAKLDWSDVKDESPWIVELVGGKKMIFSGVDCLERGDYGFDGRKEGTMTLSFTADQVTIQ